MFQVTIKAFFVVWTTIGPFQTMDQCQQRIKELKSEGIERYNKGERLVFLGKTVKPENVNMFCRKVN